MCGLIGWVSKNNDTSTYKASDYVAEQFEDQKARGVRGFGIVEIAEDGFVRIMRAKDEMKMMIDLRLSRARHILLHHRAPTSTENIVDQTHPIIVINDELKYEYAVMHNGVISNTSTLKEEHNKMGYEYTTEYEGTRYGTGPVTTMFNDSETFAVEIARFLENKSKEIKTQGPAAFIIAKMKDGYIDSIIIGTNGINPMAWNDMGYGWQFASNEKYGENLKKDEAITFKATYNKARTKMTGFKIHNDLPELIFKPAEPYKSFAPAPAPRQEGGKTETKETATQAAPSVISPYQRKNLHWNHPEDDTLHRVIGYGGGALERANLPLLPGKIEDNEDDVPDTTVKVTGFGQMLHQLRQDDIADVFKKHATHEIIEAFPYEEFAKLFNSGDIEGAEDLWDGMMDLDELTNQIDFSAVTAAALEYEFDFRGRTKTLEEMTTTARNTVNTKMGLIAREMVPIFQLQAFVETALSLGHGLAEHTKKLKEEYPTPEKMHADDWGALHLVKDCRAPEFHPELALDTEENEKLKTAAETVGNILANSRIMPQKTLSPHAQLTYKEANKRHGEAWGVDHNKALCKTPEFHLLDDEKVPTIKKDTPEEEAAIYLEVLEKTTDTMSPDEVIREAETLGELLKNVSVELITDLFLQMQAVAAEEGVALSVPFYKNKITSILDDSSTKFERLARIVKIAKEVEDNQERIMGI